MLDTITAPTPAPTGTAPAQPLAALKLANTRRTHVAELKARLRRHELTLTELVLDPPEHLHGYLLFEVLLWAPRLRPRPAARAQRARDPRQRGQPRHTSSARSPHASGAGSPTSSPADDHHADAERARRRARPRPDQPGAGRPRRLRVQQPAAAAPSRRSSSSRCCSAAPPARSDGRRQLDDLGRRRPPHDHAHRPALTSAEPAGPLTTGEPMTAARRHR